MRIISASIYPLCIPFVSAFSHNLSSRSSSDSVVVKLTADDGTVGYGEGVPRSYVTGETQDTCCEHIKTVLLPGILGTECEARANGGALTRISQFLGDAPISNGAVWNAARCAVELALLDCLLRSEGAQMGQVLPAVRDTVSYSGVISSGVREQVEQMARRCRKMGFKHVKMKVSDSNDVDCVGAVRDALGETVSLRLDANAAFDAVTAKAFLEQVEEYDIACIEQPMPRGDASELADLRAATSVPIMVDESIVTEKDARELIAADAVDYLNLRISKCGGLQGTMDVVGIAREAGVKLQLGCQVGESAILSAAGRHLAAHIDAFEFIEGSYGTHLLQEDVSEEDVTFGDGGCGVLISGEGLGLTVVEEVLNRHSGEPTHLT